MTDRATQLLDQALKLTHAERAEIAARLLETLDDESPTEQGTNDAAWMSEIRRRAERALDGEPGIPWEQAKAQLLASLRKE